MGKLYRIVPDSTATLITNGYYTDISEDLLYNIKCFNPDNSGYFGIYDHNTGITGEEMTNSLFFFTSPWSCIMALRHLRDDYSNLQAKILEYDIPDDIINSSSNVITNYTNWQAKGKMIPVDMLKNDKLVIHNELKSTIEKMILSDIKSSLKSICSSFEKYNYDKCCNFIFSRINRINYRKTQNINRVFQSDFITGKSIIVTYHDLENLFANNISELNKLIEKSNGIFTSENLQEYDFDSPTHRYGLIL